MSQTSTALQLNNALSPCQQEVFEADSWKIGNTGRTKRRDYNQDFTMLYRVVHTDRKLVDKIKCPPKNDSETRYSRRGQEQPMGFPKNTTDADPVTSNNNTELSVFSNLPSVLAARKDESRLNISYDCEYQEISPGKRIILSYQFAVYINDKDILEICFISKKFAINNRLYLRTCIGAILDLLRIAFGFEYLHHAYSTTRRYNQPVESPYFIGSEDNYRIIKTFKTEEEALNYKVDNNPLVIIDKNKIRKTNDFSDYKKNSMGITIVCHSGIVDLSAFKDDTYGFRKKDGHIIPYLKSIQGGMASIYPYPTHIPTASEYWKFYYINLLFRDTMCYAPAEGKSLSLLGKCVDVPKIELPSGTIEHMQDYLISNNEDFLAYAAQDALVTLMYGSRLWGVNKEWCLTATSGSAYAMKKSIADYLKIDTDKNGNVDRYSFDRKYKGVKTVNKGLISTPVGLRPTKNEEAISYEAEQLHRFSANSYCGGYNTCSYPGVFENIQTYDFDLENAYPTAMCLVYDIDWENPIEREFKNEDLSLQAFHTPVDPMFCLIDFEFPKDVIYPCIAIHNGSSIIFPRKAEAVYASGPSMFLALRLGAKIHIRYGYVARILLNDTTPSMSLRVACKQMVHDRSIAKDTYGKGSIEEKLLKLFVNGAYGKIAQNVIEKHTWDGWREVMEDIGCSSITSPERATMITDIVRCMLIGTMNQLDIAGKNTFSVTTDGFITEATMEEVNSCDCYGFRKLFENARLWLTDNDPTIWAVKHDQSILINPTTRCNIGFGGNKGVLAHGGFKTGEIKDSYEDAISMAATILQRSGRVTYKTTEFMNPKDMTKSNSDFYTYEQSRNIRLDFDFKRKPIKDSFEIREGSIEGISYEYVNFKTEPFEDLEEYEKYRAINSTFSCLRTKTDWEKFWIRLEDRETGYKRNLSNIEWTKLFSVIQGYRMGLWDIPEISACESVAEKLDVINKHNTTGKIFNENAWKNCRKPERASQMLPPETLLPLLKDFGYVACFEVG